jgi:p-aminobenzoyl-glutamate transporter AbgT
MRYKMAVIGTFLAKNYLWFLIAGIILLLALIGYYVESKNLKPKKLATMKYNDSPKDEVEVLKETTKEKGNITLKEATSKLVNPKEEVETLNDHKEAEPIIKEEIKSESTFNSSN